MQCVKCGFGDVRALSIDHMGGGGRGHVRSLGISGGARNFYRWLHAGGYPDGFQVLCMNCQWIVSYERGEIGKQID